jgi:hypothetical protein
VRNCVCTEIAISRQPKLPCPVPHGITTWGFFMSGSLVFCGRRQGPILVAVVDGNPDFIKVCGFGDVPVLDRKFVEPVTGVFECFRCMAFQYRIVEDSSECRWYGIDLERAHALYVAALGYISENGDIFTGEVAS